MPIPSIHCSHFMRIPFSFLPPQGMPLLRCPPRRNCRCSAAPSTGPTMVVVQLYPGADKSRAALSCTGVQLNHDNGTHSGGTPPSRTSPHGCDGVGAAGWLWRMCDGLGVMIVAGWGQCLRCPLLGGVSVCDAPCWVASVSAMPPVAWRQCLRCPLLGGVS
eukprot:gene15699-biopygen5439